METVKDMFKSIRRSYYNLCLFLQLRIRLREARSAHEAKYYPTKWLTIGQIVRQDIESYLNHEGKTKHDPLDLCFRLYGNLHDIYNKMRIVSFSCTVIVLYVSSYVYEINVPISISGLELKYDHQVLAIALAVGAVLGYQYACLFVHAQIIKSAMNTIINQNVDRQIGETLRSALLYFDNGRIYQSSSNPRLHMTKLITSPVIVIMFFALFAIIGLFIFVTFTNIEAARIIYNSSNQILSFTNILLLFSIILNIAAWMMVILSVLPLRWKDWATNDKFVILDQLRPDSADYFREEVFSQTNRLERAARKALKRI